MRDHSSIPSISESVIRIRIGYWKDESIREIHHSCSFSHCELASIVFHIIPGEDHLSLRFEKEILLILLSV